jgi:hypothetical protein
VAIASLGGLCALSWWAPSDLPGRGFTIIALLRWLSTTGLIAVVSAAAVLLLMGRGARFLLGLAPLFATLIAAGWVSMQIESRPGTDEKYDASDEIEVVFWKRATDIPQPRYAEERVYSGSSGIWSTEQRVDLDLADVGSIGKLLLTLPRVAKVGDETRVRFELASGGRADSIGQDLILEANERLMILERGGCAAGGGFSVRCRLVGRNPARASWTLRALDSGTNQLTLHFPLLFDLQSRDGGTAASSASYLATLRVNGEPELISTSDERRSRGETPTRPGARDEVGAEASETRSPGPARIVFVSSGMSSDDEDRVRFRTYRDRIVITRWGIGGRLRGTASVVDIDLENGLAEFEFDVTPTLGVSKGTYDGATVSIVAAAGSLAGAPVWLGMINLIRSLGRRWLGLGKGRDLLASS